MHRQTTVELYRYWNAIRGSRLAPRRFEIEPSDIAEYLPETLILEIDPDGACRYRLAGTRLCEIYGREFRGTSFLDQWSEPDLTTLRRRLRLIKERGAVLRFEAELKTEAGRSAVFEFLILPLVHASDRVDRMMGCIGPIEPIDWYGHDVVTSQKLGDFEFIWPETDQRSSRAVNASAHRPQDALDLPTIRHARIVRDNRRQFRVYNGGLSPTPFKDG
ncbi:MAG: PAS domain-containing protein [Pseudomonadota bacterium]